MAKSFYEFTGTSHIEQEERPEHSWLWKQIDFGQDHVGKPRHAWITNDFREFDESQRSAVFDKIRSYVEPGPKGIKRIGGGNTGDVYDFMNDPALAMKEAKVWGPYDPVAILDRHSNIVEILEDENCPPWLHTVKYYAAISPIEITSWNGHRDVTFWCYHILMEKVSDSKTMEDVRFSVSKEDQTEIRTKFNQLKKILEDKLVLINEAARQSGQTEVTFDDYFPDFREGNILTKKIDGEWHLWMIDN